jgi:hypothetical protein
MTNFQDPINRIARIDASTGLEIEAAMTSFVWAMNEINASEESPDTPPQDPAHFDQIMAQSSFLRRLREEYPEISCGPLQRGRQYWVATGAPAWLPPKSLTPGEEWFRSVTSEAPPFRAKPKTGGFYTCTGTANTSGMWQMYLDSREWSGIHVRPWRAWEVGILDSSRILEITTASEWTAFVEQNGINHDGLLYPDWLAVAREFDGVHITARAVAAAQGVRFVTQNGHITAPSYWDVETTVWLHWRVRSQRLVSTWS